MPYTIYASESNCYPGTTVLINKLGLQNQQELNAVEAALVTAKAIQWEETPQCHSFDFSHYKAIHHYLFCDLYDWAGQLRTINISKKGTCFCPASEIESVGNAIFRRLASAHYFRGLPRDLFIAELTDFYERTNELHPFREGNGRTQRLFLTQLAENAGYSLDFSQVDPDELMIATIQSANGVDFYLKELLSQIVLSDFSK